MALSEALLALPDAELERLDEALRTRRIGLDSSTALLRSYGWPASWAALLQLAREHGYTAAQLAEFTAGLRAARKAVPRRRVDLVATRPRQGDVNLLDTSVAVRRLFANAQHEVVVAGFRINDRDMLEPLRRPAGHGLDVRLFVDINPEFDALGRRQTRPASLEAWPTTWWSQFLESVWPKFMDLPRAWYAPATLGPSADGEWRSMHVKSVIVDRRILFLTSANFTRRGHERNIELGALIEDPERAEECVAVFEEWIGAGVFCGVVKG